MKYFAPAAGWLARDVALAAKRAEEMKSRPRWRCRCGRLAAVDPEKGCRAGLFGCPNYDRHGYRGPVDSCKFLPPPLMCKCGMTNPCPYPGCWHPEKIKPATEGGWVDKDGNRCDGCSPEAAAYVSPRKPNGMLRTFLLCMFTSAVTTAFALFIWTLWSLR